MSGRRTILIAGGTGFIGSHLVPALLARGDAVWIWARDPRRARRLVPAAARLIGSLEDIEPETRVDAIVNLAGAPVVGPPWTEARRRVLVESRVRPTQALIDWCARRASRPAVMISASAIGFYGTGGEHWLDENSPATDEFQSRLCQQREAATRDAVNLGIRVVNLRLGLVLGSDGGIFSRLAWAARLGAAAVLGDGRQWMSWVHVTDVLQVIEQSIGDGELSGAINLVAPGPVRQRDFQVALTRSLRRPLWLRVPAALLRLLMGEMSDLLLRSQRVAPRRLLESGFEFRYPTLEAALAELLRRGRS